MSKIEYVLGIDGGGTKTKFILATSYGHIIAETELGGSSYQSYGFDTVIKTLLHGMNICADNAEINIDDITYVAAGMPCYGENKENDSRLLSMILDAFSSRHIYVTNDSEVAWAGSLVLQPGINLVSGTGSIAFGKDEKGNTARSGGWIEFFSDEGSCYWLGRNTMELFSKQSDGREPKSKLYEIIKQEFNIKNDYEFIDIMTKQYIPYREKVAQLQLLLKKAALAGDKACIELYKKAAFELIKIAIGVRSQLAFIHSAIDLSYSGGLFKAGELILEPFKELAQNNGFVLKTPLMSPAEGAVLLAIDKFSHKNFDAAKKM